MKYSSRLISNVRALFGFGRGLMFISLFFIPLAAFVSGFKTPTRIGDLYFNSPPLTVKGAADAKTPAGELRNVRGELKLQLTTDADRAFYRFVHLTPLLVTVLMSFLVCHWMWQLCRNVEKGEIFCRSNLSLVRRLGGLLIIESVVSFGIHVWSAQRIAEYAREHLSLKGLEIVSPASLLQWFTTGGGTVQFDITSIVIGLLVLCLAEVFRQGLQLKQESELTV